MRILLVMSLVMSFSAFAQNGRVRENIKQSAVKSIDGSEKKVVKEKKPIKAAKEERKRGQ